MKVLVTGGSGFLGLALCRALLAQGYQVTSYQRHFSPELKQLGVRQVLGALNDGPKLLEAMLDQGAVLHNAAKASGWGAWDDFYQTNVVGTQCVIAGCLQLGIRKLVYTSTPSVVHDGHKPVAGGNEADTPYASRFTAHYPHTKMLAERALLAANSEALATVALRPRLIWGPGDTQLLPRLVARARKGRLRFIGDGGNKMDCTYIDNVVQAHLLALQRAEPGAACAGKAYFISNGEPKPIREIVNGLLGAAGAPLVNKALPFRLAFALGIVCEGLWRIARLDGEPPMTRFLAEQLSTEHWYDCSAARRDLGYVPDVSFAEGLLRLRASLNAKVDV
ncbi:MAG: NAD-dependent epimerase/dehydratase family protein [Arenimonas sp.]|nr:NAD-dependent epimerase/dehydratase family protein [Arenimonas sp.]